MLGRKDYTQDEFDSAEATIERQLAAHDALVAATSDEKAEAALAEFDAQFFNNLTLVLDRLFVHRIRAVTGKDSNPLNEVELICESLMNHGGAMTANKVIKFVPDQTVVKLHVGAQIQLSARDFAALSAAFFAELQLRFL